MERKAEPATGEELGYMQLWKLNVIWVVLVAGMLVGTAPFVIMTDPQGYAVFAGMLGTFAGVVGIYALTVQRPKAQAMEENKVTGWDLVLAHWMWAGLFLYSFFWEFSAYLIFPSVSSGLRWVFSLASALWFILLSTYRIPRKKKVNPEMKVNPAE